MDSATCKQTCIENTSIPIEEVEAACRIPGFPLYEAPSRNYKHMKYHSLSTNDKLYDNWRRYLNNYGGRVKRPAVFPKPNYIHFANYKPEFVIPSTSAANHRRRMRTGPGTDSYGPLPIPNDLHCRNTIGVTSRKLPQSESTSLISKRPNLFTL